MTTRMSRDMCSVQYMLPHMILNWSCSSDYCDTGELDWEKTGLWTRSGPLQVAHGYVKSSWANITREPGRHRRSRSWRGRTWGGEAPQEVRADGDSFEEITTSAQDLATFVEKMRMRKLTVITMVTTITMVKMITVITMGMMIPLSSSNCPGNAFQRDPREIEDAPY